MKYLLKYTFTLILSFIITKTFSQISLTTTSAVTEAFNIGSSTTASLPTGWKMSSAGTGVSSNWSTATNVTTVTQAAQSGNPTTGGRYNWGTSSTERSIGFMTTGSYNTPNAIMAFYQNNTGKLITALNISFDYERYRTNSGTASVTCSTSTDGTNWTSRTTGDSGPFATGSNGYTFSNPLVVNKSVSLSGLSISNGGSFYVKWVFTTTSSNSQGIGLDNVVFTPTFTPTITGSATTTAFTTTYGTPSTLQSFPISGINLTSNITATAPTGFQVSNDGTTWGATTTFTQTSGSVSGTLRIRLSSTASVTGNYNSQNIVLSSTGASSVNITTTSSGNQVLAQNLTISGISFQNKVYDGTSTVSMSGTPTFVGLVNGETFTVGGSVTWAFSSQNVGNGISILRTGDYTTPTSNYTLTQPSGFTANITKATQTITFDGLPFKSTLDVDFSPIAFTSSGLPITFTSSDVNVATIVSNKIHITGIGSTTITATQPGDGNYLPATSVTATLYVDLPVSRWSFDSLIISGTGQTPIITKGSADIGQQTENTSVTGFHNSPSTVWSSPVGNANSKSISATNWSINDYFQFTVNTQYVTIIKLTFDQTSSSTGPKDFKLQWSTNGTTFNDISTYTIAYNTTSNTPYTWSSTSYQSGSTVSFDLTTIDGINDQPSVQFRMINISNNALLGGTIQSAGTSRMDNFTMFGEINIPLPIFILDFNGKSQGKSNRLSWITDSDESIKIQKLVNNIWETVGETKSNNWIDESPKSGISYYRLQQNNFTTKPIYVTNTEVGGQSEYEVEYYNLNGNRLEKNIPNTIVIKKTLFQSEKVLQMN